jgi:hypothetical protein
MMARVDPFVQHVDDLDDFVLGDAIVENVDGSSDVGAFRAVCVSDVDAADTTRTKFRPLPCERPAGLSCKQSHRRIY